jgi:hypothetical protein
MQTPVLLFWGYISGEDQIVFDDRTLRNNEPDESPGGESPIVSQFETPPCPRHPSPCKIKRRVRSLSHARGTFVKLKDRDLRQKRLFAAMSIAALILVTLFTVPKNSYARATLTSLSAGPIANAVVITAPATRDCRPQIKAVHDARNALEDVNKEIANAEAELKLAGAKNPQDPAKNSELESTLKDKKAAQKKLIRDSAEFDDYLSDCQRDSRGSTATQQTEKSKADADVIKANNDTRRLENEEKARLEKPCEDAKRVYTEAAGKFNGACSPLDLCLDTALACSTCRGKNLPDYCPGQERDRSSSSSFSRSQVATRTKPDGLLARIKSCPIVADEHVKDLQDKMKTSKEKSGKLEDQLLDLQKDKAQSEADIQTMIDDYQQSVKKANANLERAQTSLAEKKKQELKEKLKEKSALYDKITAEIATVETETERLALNRTEGRVTLESECHSKGLIAAESYMNDKRQDIENSSATKSTQLKQWSTASVKRTKELERTAENGHWRKSSDGKREYLPGRQACLRNNSARFKSIDRAYEFGLKQLTRKVEELRAQQRTIIEGMAGEYAEEERKEVMRKIAELVTLNNEKLEELKGEFSKKVKEKEIVVAEAASKIEKLKRDLQLEQNELSQTTLLHRTADEVGTGGGKDGESTKLLAYYGTLTGAAGSLLSACGCEEGGSLKSGDELRKLPGGVEASCVDAKKVVCAAADRDGCSDSKGVGGTSRITTFTERTKNIRNSGKTRGTR